MLVLKNMQVTRRF